MVTIFVILILNAIGFEVDQKNFNFSYHDQSRIYS